MTSARPQSTTPAGPAIPAGIPTSESHQTEGGGRKPAPARGLFPLLCAAVMLEAVGVGMLFPLLARVQAADHIATSGLGLMSGAAFFAALATQVVIGRFLDGRRARAVLLAGLAVAVVSLVWFALGTRLWELSLARALGGVSYGIAMPAALRASTVGLDASQRGRRLGRLSSAQMAGIVLGPLAGAVLYGAGNLQTPFLVLAAATAVVLVGLAALPAPAGDRATDPVEAPDGPAGERGEPPGRPRPTSRPVVALLLLSVAAQVPTGLYDSLWSRLLTDRGAGTFLIGASLALFGLPFIVLAPVGGRLAALRNPLVWAGSALVVSAFFLASYGLVASPAVIVVLGMFEACAQSIAVPGGYAAVASVFPDRWAATGQSWYSGAGTAAAGASAVVAAPLYGVLGPGPVFTGAAIVSVLFVTAGVALDRSARRDPATGPVSGPAPG